MMFSFLVHTGALIRGVRRSFSFAQLQSDRDALGQRPDPVRSAYLDSIAGRLDFSVNLLFFQGAPISGRLRNSTD